MNTLGGLGEMDGAGDQTRRCQRGFPDSPWNHEASLFPTPLHASLNIPHTERVIGKTASRGQEPRQTVWPVSTPETGCSQLRGVRPSAGDLGLHVVSAGNRRAERHVGEDGGHPEAVEGWRAGRVSVRSSDLVDDWIRLKFRLGKAETVRRLSPNVAGLNHES